MIVCVCHVVNDRTVKALVDAGARSVDDITAACRAGSSCGSCREALQEAVDQACVTCPRRAVARSPYLPLPEAA